MPLSTMQLTMDLRSLGIQPGDDVLVHTSMRGLGWVDGGPASVIKALLDAVGPNGTVLFPTLTGSASDGPDNPPNVDLRTRACASWVGIVPEAARTWPGSMRSVHPTHSVTAIGANAGRYATGHELGKSPCDEQSPYFTLMRRDGKILLLGGVTHQSNTSLHCVEELAGAPYHLQRLSTTSSVIATDGSRHTIRNRLHDWTARWQGRQWQRDFPRVAPILEGHGAQRSAPIGPTISTLVSAAQMRELLVPLVREDPSFLLNLGI